MLHAREDYNRIQDPSGLIPEDEPVILFRAQDKLTAEVAEFYAQRCREEGAYDIASSIDLHILKIKVWPKKKLPDMPKE